MDRELRQSIKSGLQSLDRIADSIDRALEEPKVEIEIPPPKCPHCNQINPEILVEGEQIKGKLAEFILFATCLHCKKRFFGLPFVWGTFTNKQDALVNVKQHLERVLGNGSN